MPNNTLAGWDSSIIAAETLTYLKEELQKNKCEVSRITV